MIIKYRLAGRIDSNSSVELESNVMDVLNANHNEKVEGIEFDAKELSYISSAGLRVLLIFKKKWKNVSIINVSPEVYEIFEVTGFTSIVDIQKCMRDVSIDGLQLIGKGANGEVYRLDNDKIIKVYNPISNTLDRIQREKDVARKAFIYDIPSAISYDIVKVGDRYGMIYELINSSTLGQFVTKNPDKLEEYAKRMAGLLKKLHSTEFETGVLPDARKNLQVWVDIAEQSNYYSEEAISKLRKFIDSIPYRNTFIHGDFHPGNIMVVDGELILIDMTDASVGDPIIDLIGSYHIMRLAARREGGAERYTGMSSEMLNQFWNVFIREYTGIVDESELMLYEKKLRYYCLIRSFAGITFSDMIPKEVLPEMTKKVEKAFLDGYRDTFQNHHC